MIDDFIRMINNIDFLYGFIYGLFYGFYGLFWIYLCMDSINNLYDYDNYDHLAIKLCSEFIMPIINITKKNI